MKTKFATVKTETYDDIIPGCVRYRLTLSCGHVVTSCYRLKSVPCGECNKD